MTSVRRLVWLGLLTVIATRLWVLDLFLPQRIIIVQWIGLGFGIAWFAANQGWRKRLDIQLLVPCLLLIFGYLFSTTLSTNRSEAFLQGQSLLFGIVTCMAIVLAPQPRRQQLMVVLAASGMALSLQALWQATVLFPKYEHFDWLSQGVPQHVADFATLVIGRRRVFGPFPLPALLAGALVVLIPITVTAMHQWIVTPWKRLVAFAVIATQITVLFLTQSLGGLLSICAATLLVLTLHHSTWRARLTMLVVTVVSVGTLLALRPELTDLNHPRNPIVQRWRYWNSTAGMIADHPIRGIGAGNYAAFYPRYQLPKSTLSRFAHNVWLHTWAEWGIVGLMGLVGLFLGSVRLAASQPIGIQIACWAFWMIASIDITWSITQVAILFWPLLGLLTPPPKETA